MTKIPANIRVPAEMGSLQPLLEFVGSCLTSQGFSEDRLREIELAMEEILVNIFNYAYPDQKGEVEISCRCDGGKGVLVEVSDQGLSFDPLSLESPDLQADIAERAIGGLGVFFVKQLIPGVWYRREEGRNILTLPIEPAVLL